MSFRLRFEALAMGLAQESKAALEQQNPHEAIHKLDHAIQIAEAHNLQNQGLWNLCYYLQGKTIWYDQSFTSATQTQIAIRALKNCSLQLNPNEILPEQIEARIELVRLCGNSLQHLLTASQALQDLEKMDLTSQDKAALQRIKSQIDLPHHIAITVHKHKNVAFAALAAVGWFIL